MAGSRFQILFAVVALGMLAGAVIAVAYFFEKELMPEKAAIEGRDQAIKSPATERPDPGKKAYVAAVEMIKTGDLIASRDKLLYLMKYYPDSSKYEEAKRILGEINADLLLSDGPGDTGKYQYTIKRGDYLSVLARKHQCTIDYIFRANGKTNHFVHIGDKVWVAPLVFAIEANIASRSLTVYRIEEVEPEPGAEVGGGEAAPLTQEVFFKEYEIADVNLPPTVRVPYRTKITSKPAWLGTKRATFEHADYHKAQKWLQTGKPGLAIRLIPPESSDSKDEAYGILMSPANMNELFTYIRAGAMLRVTD